MTTTECSLPELNEDDNDGMCLDVLNEDDTDRIIMSHRGQEWLTTAVCVSQLLNEDELQCVWTVTRVVNNKECVSPVLNKAENDRMCLVGV